jgi:hypothetical protein
VNANRSSASLSRLRKIETGDLPQFVPYLLAVTEKILIKASASAKAEDGRLHGRLKIILLILGKLED